MECRPQDGGRADDEKNFTSKYSVKYLVRDGIKNSEELHFGWSVHEISTHSSTSNKVRTYLTRRQTPTAINPGEKVYATKREKSLL